MKYKTKNTKLTSMILDQLSISYWEGTTDLIFNFDSNLLEILSRLNISFGKVETEHTFEGFRLFELTVNCDGRRKVYKSIFKADRTAMNKYKFELNVETPLSKCPGTTTQFLCNRYPSSSVDSYYLFELSDETTPILQ